MAHELTNTDHMFSAERTPWHGLGTVTTGALTLDEALHTAKLDWTVEKRPLYVTGPDGPVEVPNRFALVRMDNFDPLGVVGETYQELQNTEGFGLLGALLEGGEIDVETAGSLRGGRYVWALAKMHRDMRCADKHVPYVLFVTGHDGQTAVKLAVTPVRVVCMNTLRMALGSTRSSFTLRHTTNLQSRVQEAREVLGLSWAYLDNFEEEVDRLTNTTFSDDQFEELVAKVWPLDAEKDGKQKVTMTTNRRAEVERMWTEAVEIKDVKGTAWGAFQSFSTWDLWQRGGGTEETTDERQAMRIISGRSEAFNVEVLGKVRAIANL